MGRSAPATTTTTTTQNNEPWSAAQPFLNQAMTSASAEFNNGPLQYYPGQTIAPMSNQTIAGLNGVQNNAGMSSNLANMQLGTLGNVMGGQRTPGTGNVASVAMGGRNNPWQGYFGAQASGANPYSSGILNAATARTDTSAMNPYLNQNGYGQLVNTANGGMYNSNPYLDSAVNRATNSAMNNVNATFSQGGRFGSGMHADTVARATGDVASGMYGAAYDQERANQMNASNALASMGYSAAQQMPAYFENDMNRAMSGYGQAGAYGLQSAQMGAGLYNTDLSNAFNAYQMLANQGNAQSGLQMQAAGMLPGVYDFANQGARDLMGVGATMEDYNQQLINSDIDRFNFNQNAPRQNIEWLNAIASGQGMLGGTQTGTQQVPYQRSNPFLSGAGGAMAGAQMGSMFGPMGMGIGAGIGGLAGLFSDRRLKKNIEPLHTDERGVHWYAYQYLWDDDRVTRVGVLADELAAIAPSLVRETPGGFYAVDYNGLKRWGREHVDA